MLYFIHTSFLGLTLETGLLSVVDFLSVDFFKKLLLLEAVRKNDSSLKNFHHLIIFYMQHINKQTQTIVFNVTVSSKYLLNPDYQYCLVVYREPDK